MADPATMEAQRRMYDASISFANAQLPGMHDASQQALQNYQNFGQTGNLGLGAMSGDAAALGQFMNPYQQHVVDNLHNAYDQTRQRTMQSVNDAATRAGAFGGSRHGIATGQALADISRQETQQIGDVLHSGFSNAMGRATQAANLGFGAANAMHGYGMDARNAAIQQAGHRFNTLQQAITPLGQTQTQSVQQGSPLAGALGGAAAGSTLGPWGALAGGLLGLFG